VYGNSNKISIFSAFSVIVYACILCQMPVPMPIRAALLGSEIQYAMCSRNSRCALKAHYHGDTLAVERGRYSATKYMPIRAALLGSEMCDVMGASGVLFRVLPAIEDPASDVFASLGQCCLLRSSPQMCCRVQSKMCCRVQSKMCCRVQSSSWCTKQKRDLHDDHAFMPKSQLGSGMPRGRAEDTASGSGSVCLLLSRIWQCMPHGLVKAPSDPAGELDPCCDFIFSQELNVLGGGSLVLVIFTSLITPTGG